MDKGTFLTSSASEYDINVDAIKNILHDITRSHEYRRKIFLLEPNGSDAILTSNIHIDYTSDDIISESNIYSFGIRPSVSLSGMHDYNGNIYKSGMGGYIDIRFKLTMGYITKYDFIRVFYPEYLTHLRDIKLKSMGVTIVDKISNRLTDYLGFDSDDLFKCGSLIRVFGGAIRDSIRGDKINDIDVLCGSKSIKSVESLLLNNGYIYMESLTPKDLSAIYTDINVITEPHSWVKGDKIVQVIKPATSCKLSESDYIKSFTNLISNVDISCCGVSYDSEDFYENFTNAIIHIQSKVFSVNKSAMMYSEKRIHHRIAKFIDRGWTQIENVTHINRDLKIGEILS